MTDSKANDVEIAGKDGDAVFPVMQLRSDTRPKRQADVVTLGASEAKLLALNMHELLERASVRSKRLVVQ